MIIFHAAAILLMSLMRRAFDALATRCFMPPLLRHAAATRCHYYAAVYTPRCCCCAAALMLFTLRYAFRHAIA